MPLSANAALSKDKSTGKSVSLQHRHFAFIAAVLKDCMPGEHAATFMTAGEQWTVSIALFADACARSNPNFNRARFLRACNVICA